MSSLASILKKKIDAPAYAVITGAYPFIAATGREDRYILGRGDQNVLGRLRYLSPTLSIIIINHFLYSSSLIQTIRLLAIPPAFGGTRLESAVGLLREVFVIA